MFDREESPEQRAAPRVAADVLTPDVVQGLIVEHAPDASVARYEHVLRDLPQRAAEPAVDGDAEAVLAAPPCAARYQIGAKSSEQRLYAEEPDFLACWNGCEQLDETLVQKGRSKLETMSHGAAVHLHREVARQIRDEVDVEDPIE